VPAGHVSFAVSAATRKDTQDLDHVGVGVACETHPPVADAQAPFVLNAGEAHHVAGRRVAGQAVERLDDAVLDLL